MATIYLAVEVERTEGKFVSTLDVGEAVVDALDGESVDVEDSVYDVTSVEVIDGPKTKAAPTGLTGKDWLDLDIAFRAFASAFPPRMDKSDPDPYANLTDTQRMFVLAFSKVAFSPNVGAAIDKAKAAAYKADQARKSRT